MQTLVLARPDCADDAGSWCAQFYEWTNNDVLARSADMIVSTTVTVVVIAALALVARWALHRTIHRLVDGATNSRLSRLVGRAPGIRRDPGSAAAVRSAQRARTLGSILRSIASVVVLGIAAIMIVSEFGVDLGPILASAGIVGIAVGFGAQNLVRDFLSGMFMLLEDQYGIGDIVDLGEASGVVEAVGLRITTLRDLNGTVWYVRNGEILRVGNKSQGYAVAVVDIPIGHSADTSEAIALIGRVAAERVVEDDIADAVLEPVEVLGADQVTPAGVTLRLTVKVSPGKQWLVQRALNATITDAFDEAGIPRPEMFPGAGPPVRG